MRRVNRPLFAACLVLVGCPEPESTAGQETSACVDGACLGELMCLSDVCVAPEDSGSTGNTSETSTPTTETTTGQPTSTSTPTTTLDPTADDSSSEGSSGPSGCRPPEHAPCDEGTADPHRAMGLGCPDETPVVATSQGDALSIGVRGGFGSTARWDPTEGSRFAVISTGYVAELDEATPPGDDNISPTYCNDDVDGPDPGKTLPEPIQIAGAGGDCIDDPALLGEGDCSNTIADQFSQGGSAFDYVELRSVIEVPAGVQSMSYDFAFFSTEYPFYFGDVFNDMFIVWLESELWTGNTAFDDSGTPISLNAGFLDFRDDTGDLPEFEGTCMRQHAGTRWLRSASPVVPADDITLVFATFDLSDPILDTVVFLDNVQWSCDAVERPTTTAVR